MMEARILMGFKKFNDGQKDKPCAESRRKKETVVELRRNKVAECQSRNRVAVVKTKDELLKTEQELKC